MPQRAIVDSHIHFWDVNYLTYEWLADEPGIDRPFLPQDLDTGTHAIDGFVFIQADCTPDEALDEVAWVNALAEDWPIRGIVAHAPIEKDTAALDERLAQLRQLPRVVGIRRLFQGEPPGFLTHPEVLAGVQAVGRHSLPFDICVAHEQLGETAELVARCSDVQFVLDHVGKPDVAAGRLEPWREELAALAEYKNVVAKLSGLTTEADVERWRQRDVQPYLAHALDVFGADRCLFGSDWPVATLATDYARWVDVVADAVGHLPERDQAKVFSGNAARIYGFS